MQDIDLKKLIPCYFGAFIGPMGGMAVLTLIPFMSKGLNTSIEIMSLAITFYMIPFAFIQFFSGALADVFNPIRILIFGYAVFVLGSFFCALAPGIGWFLSARLIQGFGGAFIFPLVMALLADVVPPDYLGRVMGVLGMVFSAGVSTGPIMAGVVEVYLGWRWFFGIVSLQSAAACLLFVWGFRQYSDRRRSGQVSQIFTLIKVALRDKNVVFLSLSASVLFFSFIGVLTFTSDYLEEVFRLKSNQIGLIISSAGIAGIFASPVAGYLGDRKGRNTVAYGGFVMIVISYMAIIFTEYSYLKYLLIFSIYGIGSAVAWTSMNTLAVEIRPEMKKTVAALYNFFRFFGYSMAPIVLTPLYKVLHIKSVFVVTGLASILSCILLLRVQTKPLRAGEQP